MNLVSIKGSQGIRGSISLPGDKSIAHRSVILASLADGTTSIRNFPLNSDCLSTLSVLKRLGADIRVDGSTVLIRGKGLDGLRPPRGGVIKIKESGTTYRLMLGVLAGQPFPSVLEAGPGLARRPMLRVNAPLRSMGARISGKTRKGEEYPPARVEPARLSAIRFKPPVASAQVKSAVLLAGLFARGTTVVSENLLTRDHTERMLKLFKARVSVSGRTVSVKGGTPLVSPGSIYIPGDISSAAFFIVLAAIVPGSSVKITGVSLNPTRTGVLTVLKRMGARISVGRVNRLPEPWGDIRVESGGLKATVVRREEIPFLIDELPVLMVSAACARGRTLFESVGELRVKETDRIRSMVSNLDKMGVRCSVVRERGMESVAIQGGGGLKGARVSSFGDHRTAMSMAVAGLRATGTTVIDGCDCVAKSFPGFFTTLKKLNQGPALF